MIELRAHEDQALYRFDQRIQRGIDDFDHLVVSLLLLLQHDGEAMKQPFAVDSEDFFVVLLRADGLRPLFVELFGYLDDCLVG